MLRGRTRVLNACQRCRRQKIKCSGLPPCRTCRDRGVGCHFGAEDKQVLISERELFELRNRSSRSEDPQREQEEQTTSSRHEHSDIDTPRDSIADPLLQSMALQISHNEFSHSADSPRQPEATEDSERLDVANPLVPRRPVYISESSGKLRYLGHSSSFAFTQQVLHMLYQGLPSNPSPEVFLGSEGQAYKAELNRLIPLANPEVSELPSKDVAMHYLQCVKFRTNPLFHLFDNASFYNRVQEFYKDPLAYAQSSLIWFVHYLILMALGRALDPYGQMTKSSGSAVSPYLTRGLQLLPDLSYLCDDPIEATEVFCCITLYLQSIDHRSAAALYIGHAVRMAHLYALHLDLDENIVGVDATRRGRHVWWTVYALNQKVTLSLGIPNIINEEDILSPLPSTSDSDEDSAALLIHVKICKLQGLLMSRVYGSSERYQTSFASTARTVLKGAAEIADALKKYSARCFGEISRVAAHLELAYHLCIILTCRPALFYILKLRSESWVASQAFQIPSSMTGLIQACVDSATQAAQILSQLKKYNLLDTFLPFDLECAFSAAFVLVMAGQLFPKIGTQDQSIESIKEVFITIATWGNAHAELRKLEIEQLDEMLRRQTQVIRGIKIANLPQVPEAASETAARQPGFIETSQMGAPFFSNWTFDAGLSGNQIMSLAEGLDARELSSLNYWSNYERPL